METETRQPGKVLDKIKTNHTYPEVTNYWTPLDIINEEDEEEINSTSQKAPEIQEQQQGNKWTRQLAIRRGRWKEHQIIIDFGATSQFLSDEINSPNMGQLNEKVYLPDGSTLTTKHKTLLPFDQLTTTTREASVLTGLKKSLASVSEWADEGYTTIFHSGENGVTGHRPDSLSLIFGEPPVLQGYKACGAKFGQRHKEGARMKDQSKYTTNSTYHQQQKPSSSYMQQQDTR
jgi:hypothetical protein